MIIGFDSSFVSKEIASTIFITHQVEPSLIMLILQPKVTVVILTSVRLLGEIMCNSFHMKKIHPSKVRMFHSGFPNVNTAVIVNYTRSVNLCTSQRNHQQSRTRAVGPITIKFFSFPSCVSLHYFVILYISVKYAMFEICYRVSQFS